MTSLETLTMKELIIKLKTIDGYENISRQQLESIFKTSPALKATPKTVPGSKKSKTAERTSISIDDEFGKSDMAKNRILAENTWYKLYDWLINHIPESVKNSGNIVKEKIMRIFQRKPDIKRLVGDYKAKRIPGSFNDKYIEHESEVNKRLLIEQYLDQIR